VFPWDTLVDVTALARSHPDGIVDLSVGTPVDPVSPLIREALAAASAAPGYPTTAVHPGATGIRDGGARAPIRRDLDWPTTAALPVIGTKELIAWLPTLLGLGPDDVLVVPELAYPTYEVGAQLAGVQVVRADSLTQLGPQSPALVYLNSPSNPMERCSASSICARWWAGHASERRIDRVRRVLSGPRLGRPAGFGASSLGLATATSYLVLLARAIPCRRPSSLAGYPRGVRSRRPVGGRRATGGA